MIHQHQAQLFANQQNFMNDMNYLQYRHKNDIYNYV
jgi:hypothetical protein